MITINDHFVKTFIRIQVFTAKDPKEIVQFVTESCNDLYKKDEIEVFVDEILKEGHKKNKEVIDKLLLMIKQFAIDDYKDLNVDEDGLDEKDRIMMDVIQSIGLL